ncbi:MAG TPA: NADH-quinone oxidoreductase subunit I [Candidatus Polarisedimenticolia bacterium]|jgi:NADH-quinone oxidoreductase subunit I
MAIVVDRKLGWFDRLYLPGIVRGMRVTLKHLFRRKFTMQYPEQRWTFPEGFRGVPALVKDQEGRTKCVACFLCQFVCPPKAIMIVPGELPGGNKVEKYPKEFEINMLRCIYCGMCEEVCPEQAIFLTKDYEVAGSSRTELIFNKEKLLEIGGVRPDPIMKWAHK